MMKVKDHRKGKARKRKVKVEDVAGFLLLALFLILVIYIAVPSPPETSQSITYTSILISSTTEHKSILKVAIVDQLSAFSSGSYFVGRAESILEQAGFSVDIYGPERVTVNLYGSLAGHGYRLILFRVHAGVNEEMEGLPVGLFTTESYSQLKYPQEQLKDLVGSAQAFNRTEVVFAVTPKFIREKSIVDYDGAVIILMGCFGLYSPDLPQAFIDRGASVVLGWDGLVDLEHTDEATLVLLRKMFLERMTVDESVTATLNEVGHDSSGSTLGYYPSNVANMRLVGITSRLEALWRILTFKSLVMVKLDEIINDLDPRSPKQDQGHHNTGYYC
jgi:hypothetical protein